MSVPDRQKCGPPASALVRLSLAHQSPLCGTYSLRQNRSQQSIWRGNGVAAGPVRMGAILFSGCLAATTPSLSLSAFVGDVACPSSRGIRSIAANFALLFPLVWRASSPVAARFCCVALGNAGQSRRRSGSTILTLDPVIRPLTSQLRPTCPTKQLRAVPLLARVRGAAHDCSVKGVHRLTCPLPPPPPLLVFGGVFLLSASDRAQGRFLSSFPVPALVSRNSERPRFSRCLKYTSSCAQHVCIVFSPGV